MDATRLLHVLSENRTQERRCRRHHPTVLLAVTILWAVVVGTGLYQLWSYAHLPGVEKGAPGRWPETSRIQRPQDKSVLLFFAHSRCPCTRASLRELERLMARVHGKVETHVVFFESTEMEKVGSWNNLRESGSDIPGVHVFRDFEGVECKLFRAKTSGLTILYSDKGTLLFQGGVTPSRGHEGANDGIAALERLILGARSPIRQTPVFGCPL